MAHGILLHEKDDNVGVSVADIRVGMDVGVVTLEGQPVGTVTAIQDIPLGHKVAMRDLAEGQDVMEYGRPIGRAAQAISRGAHVHTHNLKSKRWGL